MPNACAMTVIIHKSRHMINSEILYLSPPAPLLFSANNRISTLMFFLFVWYISEPPLSALKWSEKLTPLKLLYLTVGILWDG